MEVTTPAALARAYKARTGVSLTASTVRRLCQSGVVEASKVGRSWIIAESSAEKFLTSGWRPYETLRQPGKESD